MTFLVLVKDLHENHNDEGGLEMAYMKKNVNFGLLALLLVIIMIFIGFTLYYQQTFNNLVYDYTTKLGQLEQVTRDLTKHKDVLTETKTELNRTTGDVESLARSYEDIVDANERLTNQLTIANRDLATRTTELNTEKARTISLTSAVATRDKEIGEWKTKYDAEVVKYNDMRNRYLACDSNLEDCDDAISACGCNY